MKGKLHDPSRTVPAAQKHLKLVITLPVVCAIAMGIVSFVAMDNTYTATTSMYILAKTDDSGQMSYNDLSASQMLSNDIATLLDSDSVKSGAANELGLTDLDDYKVSVSSETTTRVITLSVTGTDAKETAKVAKAMASSVSTVAQNVGAAQSINVIDEAKTPKPPAVPSVCCTLLSRSSPVSLSQSPMSFWQTCSIPASAVPKRQKSSWAFPLLAEFRL